MFTWIFESKTGHGLLYLRQKYRGIYIDQMKYTESGHPMATQQGTKPTPVAISIQIQIQPDYPLRGITLERRTSCRQSGHSGFSRTQSLTQVQQKTCPQVVTLGSLKDSKQSVHLLC